MSVIPIQIQHSFCAAKWAWVTLHFGMESNHSCYHPAPHHWKLLEVANDTSAIHNTVFKEEQRQKMLDGERPKECRYCWEIEDSGPDLISDRKHFNKMFAEVIPDALLNNEQSKKPRYLEVSFNNSCNLACSYCSPGQSSRWHEEVSKFGPYPVADMTNKVLHPQLKEEENPYINAFWQWLPTVYSNLKWLRITGGEPLMSNAADKLLDYITNHSNKELNVAINTNLCTPDRRIDKLITQCHQIQKTANEVKIFTSCDTYGDRAEYIRYGFNWDRWCINTERCLKEKIEVIVMVTFGALSIFDFTKFIDKIVEWRDKGYNIQMNCSALIDPKHFDLRIHGDMFQSEWSKLAEYMVTNKSKLLEHELRTLDNLFALRKNYEQLPDRHALKRDFVNFFIEHDHRRSTDILLAFPELTEVINEFE